MYDSIVKSFYKIEADGYCRGHLYCLSVKNNTEKFLKKCFLFETSSRKKPDT